MLNSSYKVPDPWHLTILAGQLPSISMEDKNGHQLKQTIGDEVWY
jgi:hypothetical protein